MKKGGKWSKEKSLSLKTTEKQKDALMDLQTEHLRSWSLPLVPCSGLYLDDCTQSPVRLGTFPPPYLSVCPLTSFPPSRLELDGDGQLCLWTLRTGLTYAHRNPRALYTDKKPGLVNAFLLSFLSCYFRKFYFTLFDFCLLHPSHSRQGLMYPRLALNLLKWLRTALRSSSSCLYLLSVRIVGMGHRAWVKGVFY